jgi:hypothetical protein
MYLTGFVNGADWNSINKRGVPICFPKYFTGAEARAIFIREMRATPSLGRTSTEVALGRIFEQQFPCNSN